MPTSYTVFRRLALTLWLGLVAACAQPPAAEQERALVQIDVAKDVAPGSAQISVNGTRKGFVGPGCKLLFALEPGEHVIQYRSDKSSIETTVETLIGQTLFIQIESGPRFTVVAKPDKSDVCSS